VTGQNAALAPPEKIVPALVHHFAHEEPGGVVLEKTRLIELLRKLPSLSSEDHVDPIVTQLQIHEPGAALSKEDLAIVSFVDDATTQVLGQTDLDFKIEAYIRDLAPFLAAHALENDIHAITRPHEVFDLIDLMIEECIGWSEDLGILGDQFMEKVESAMSGISSGRSTVKQCTTDLQAVFKKEEPLFEKLEERLCHRELKVLSGKKAQFICADLLNKEMTGQKLPLFVIFMIQGPWFEFLQQVFVEYGEKSKEFENVRKMTEAMIWSLQPDRDKAKQSSVIKSLPASIRKFCEKAPFETDPLIESLADLEGEYEAIESGEPSDPCDFELLETDESMLASLQAATRDAIEEVKAIATGQWFLYDDPAEPDEKVARIKLILNWTETEQLLLTNHNRRKIVNLSYGEMVNFVESGVLRKLNPMQSAAETFKAHLFTVLRSVSDQNKKEKKIEVREERKAVSEEYSSQRKEELEHELQLIAEKAERKKQRAMVLRDKARKKQEVAEATVKALRQDAWVKLPIMEGTLTPCKLVAIIPATETYIFANRAGLKVADYTASQLAHMIVTENSEILDTGAEFESALATVVSGLREDKNKSYEELTGDSS
jgi:hypothetical protein